MKRMAIIGIVLYGLILIAGIYKIIIELIAESNGVHQYASGHMRDLAITELFVAYAFVFSVAVYVKSKKNSN